MSDRREEILKAEYFKYYRPTFLSDDRNAQVVNKALCIKEETQTIKNAMDEYMKECCLELLEYMAKKNVSCTVVNGVCYFFSQGECITKEQLFENFL